MFTLIKVFSSATEFHVLYWILCGKFRKSSDVKRTKPNETLSFTLLRLVLLRRSIAPLTIPPSRPVPEHDACCLYTKPSIDKCYTGVNTVCAIERVIGVTESFPLFFWRSSSLFHLETSLFLFLRSERYTFVLCSRFFCSLSLRGQNIKSKIYLRIIIQCLRKYWATEGGSSTTAYETRACTLQPHYA